MYNFQNVMEQLFEGDMTVYEQPTQSVNMDTQEPEYLGKFVKKEIVQLRYIYLHKSRNLF